MKKKKSRIQKLKMDAGAKPIPMYPWDQDDEFGDISRAETPGAYREAADQRLEAFESIQDTNQNPYETQIKNDYPWGKDFKKADNRPAKEIYKEQSKKKVVSPSDTSKPLARIQSRGFYKFGLFDPSALCCLSLIATMFCPWCAMDHITHAVGENIQDSDDSLLDKISFYCCYLAPCFWACTGMKGFQVDQHIQGSFESRLCISTCCLPCEINREYRQLITHGRIHPDIIKLRGNCFFWDFDGWRFKSDCCNT